MSDEKFDPSGVVEAIGADWENAGEPDHGPEYVVQESMVGHRAYSRSRSTETSLLPPRRGRT